MEAWKQVGYAFLPLKINEHEKRIATPVI